MKNFVAYYRVSTKRQGVSGLGLEAQKQTVKDFVKKNNIIAEFTEVETGKRDNRTELKKAIEHAKKNNAKLIIAKLDRLSRNVSFIFQLRDANVDFVCCDLPDMNTLSIGIFASLAQYEREIISERTKKALKAKKAQGFKLGSPKNLTAKARAKGLALRIKRANENENNIRAFALIKAERKNGNSYPQTAKSLNDHGFKTSRGYEFHPMQVKRIFDRYRKKTTTKSLI